jgi:biopolymer transport protein ExbD
MARNRISCSTQIVNDEPVVNLTPLIDVVFVILIMFIVIAPLLELDRVELAEAPRTHFTAPSSVHENSPITLHVHENNTIWFDNRQITLSELAPLLKEAKMKHPEARPQIFHDKKAQFGTYQSVKNAAEEAGFGQIDIILKPA